MFRKLISEDNVIRRRAGLYGISVITVSLYSKATCDAMFNIIKICKDAILHDKQFFEIFDEIIDLIQDFHSEIKDWAKKVDDLLKDAVYSSLSRNSQFDLDQLIKHICEKLTFSQSNEVIIVLIKWIEVLYSISNVNILQSVPKFLEKLLINIDNKGGNSHKNSDHNNKDVCRKSHEQLGRFLGEFKNYERRTVQLDKKIINKLLKFLLKNQKDKLVSSNLMPQEGSKLEALFWLRDFLTFFKTDFSRWQVEEQMMIQQNQIRQKQYEEQKLQTQNSGQSLKVQEEEKSDPANRSLMTPLDDSMMQEQSASRKFIEKIFQKIFPRIIEVILKYSSWQKQDCQQTIQEINDQLLELVLGTMINKSEFQNIFGELKKQFKESQTLVNKVLELLCMLSKKNEKYLKKIIKKLIERFSGLKDMNQDKMNQVIYVLCQSIKSEKVFLEFANILKDIPDLYFVQDMIETLTITIAADHNYEGFRNKLRGKKGTEFVQSKEQLFYNLYKTWCYSPISTLTLCLMSRNYELAYNLIQRFTMIELDTTRQIQLGNLVYLLESPSFCSNLILIDQFLDLRIELMRQDRQTQYLLKTLQGILMILPISKSFQSLKTRLECINVATFELPLAQNQQASDFFGEDYSGLEINECLKCFDDKLEQIQEFYKNREEEMRKQKQQMQGKNYQDPNNNNNINGHQNQINGGQYGQQNYNGMLAPSMSVPIVSSNPLKYSQ
ncbi:vac14 family protein [Stylonychia lemnae]|uniref:Vac14 family protein n=1 Tax=Stylonychia lemnae TaxID=5949 RepID=A0A078A8Q0_STYLE|nr:vac14 family protein [Stylonychia lemnae]|eukprot:CDW77902.1 vac14 family protein [Stylonychia lemnae]